MHVCNVFAAARVYMTIGMSLKNRWRLGALVLAIPAFAASAPVPGIHNFHQVDQQVYRGAQPTPDGFKYLAKLGVKVVLDLRGSGKRSANEERLVTAGGMRYVNVPMSGLAAPTQDQINKVLTLLEDPSNKPVFVHCRRGADRTGAVIAAYRIDHHGWDNTAALREAMVDGMSWFQFQRQAFIRAFRARRTAANESGFRSVRTHPGCSISESPAGL